MQERDSESGSKPKQNEILLFGYFLWSFCQILVGWNICVPPLLKILTDWHLAFELSLIFGFCFKLFKTITINKAIQRSKYRAVRVYHHMPWHISIVSTLEVQSHYIMLLSSNLILKLIWIFKKEHIQRSGEILQAFSCIGGIILIFIVGWGYPCYSKKAVVKFIFVFLKLIEKTSVLIHGVEKRKNWDFNQDSSMISVENEVNFM